MINIVLVGFGNIAHAIAANAPIDTFNIQILSTNESRDDKTCITNINNGNVGNVSIKGDKKKCLKQADYLLFCVPSHIRKQALQKLVPYIQSHTVLGAFPGVSGFNEEVKELLPYNKYYFSTQRVPYISRVLIKGKSVAAVRKPKTDAAISSSFSDTMLVDLSILLGQPIELLPSFDLVNLTNSNPLLHTSRIYDFLKNSHSPYLINENEMFYENWTDGASRILIEMDIEFQCLMKIKGYQTSTILKHYDVGDARQLSQKLASIKAFKGIKFPMVQTDGNFQVNFNSRYFKEDFEFGLRYTIRQADKVGIHAQFMKQVYNFYKKIITNDASTR